MKIALAIFLLALAVHVGGCGSSGETTAAPEQPVTEQAAAQTEPPARDLSEIKRTPAEEAQLEREYADASRWKVLKNAAGDQADRLIIPVGPPPEKKVIVRDLRVGKGPGLDAHDQFRLESLAFDYSEANLGENSFGEAGLWFTFGTGDVNEGWEIGLRGMRAGGMRELIFPAAVMHDDDASVYLIRLTRVAKE
jgi:hypothetical protein